MTEPLVKAPASVAGACEVCGASLRAGDTRCWLCGAIAERGAVPIGLPYAAPITHTAGFSLASLMIFVTLVCVVLGVSSLWPGIGIPLGVVLFVVWLRTTLITRHRAAHGLTFTTAEKVQLFIESFGVTIGLIFVTCVAGGAALFAALGAICIATSPVNSSDSNESIPWVVGGAIVTTFSIFALVKLVKFSRSRWRRDIGESD
jgi:hypothetical protein